MEGGRWKSEIPAVVMKPVLVIITMVKLVIIFPPYFVMNVFLGINTLYKKLYFFFPSGLLPLTCNTTDILCQYLSVTNFTPLCKYGNQEKSETCLRAVNCSLGEGNPTFSIVCKVIVLCFLELWPCLYLYLEIKCGLKTCMWPSRQGVDS